MHDKITVKVKSNQYVIFSANGFWYAYEDTGEVSFIGIYDSPGEALEMILWFADESLIEFVDYR